MSGNNLSDTSEIWMTLNILLIFSKDTGEIQDSYQNKNTKIPKWLVCKNKRQWFDLWFSRSSLF